MKKDKILYIIILSVFSINIYAQKTKSNSAEQNNKTIAVVSPMKTYEKVADKGYQSAVIFKKLGDTYFFDEQLDKAVKWYGKLFDLNIELESEYYYRYSQSLRAVGENNKADEMMEKFKQMLELTTDDK